jgi:hypothetical protein
LAPYHTELPAPSDTSPITEAVGATNTAPSVSGTEPCVGRDGDIHKQDANMHNNEYTRQCMIILV